MAQAQMRLHPFLNKDTIEQVIKMITASGEQVTAASLVRYLNRTGYPDTSLEQLEKSMNKVMQVYDRYVDYRSNPEEYVFIPESLEEFEAFKKAEKGYGGESFVLSTHDIVKIIEEGGEEENILHSCIRKDSLYLTSYINSIYANNNLDLLEAVPIYGFYKRTGEHNATFARLMARKGVVYPTTST